MKKKLSIILCILWMGFIFYNSSQPGYKSNERSVKVLNVIKQFKNDTLNIIKELISDDKRSSLNKHIIYNEDKSFNKSDKSLNINLAINKNKSNYTKVSIEEVNKIENTINLMSTTSLDTVIFQGNNEVSIIDTIKEDDSLSPESIIEEKEKLEILTKAIDMLKEKDKLVLALYYYEELTLKEIGYILEVSESRVSQLHSRAIVNLRNTIKKLNYKIS